MALWSFLERSLRPFVSEPTLWPILLVLVAHLALAAAPAMLWSLEGSALARVALAGMLGGSAAAIALEWRHAGRLGWLTGLVLGSWAASVASAWLVDRYDLI